LPAADQFYARLPIAWRDILSLCYAFGGSLLPGFVLKETISGPLPAADQY